MIIDSYDVQTSSQRTFLSATSTKMRTLRAVRPMPLAGAANSANRANGASSANNSEDRVSISKQARDMHMKAREDGHRRLAESAAASATAKTKHGPKVPETPEQLKQRLLEMMLEMMTGKKHNVKQQMPDAGIDMRQNQGMPGFAAMDSSQMQVIEKISMQQFQYESENLSYQAHGIVKTADGRTISMDISMSMSREFVSYMNINMENVKPVDPLVINYGGTAASLKGERFQFDLDMDGKMDNLAVLGEGSGFLAIDLNGDGKINDGRELFGPNSGCGFGELRQYDQDGNGWIDEADDVFSKLVVWSRDKDGNDKQFTLKELGIGAIYLGNISTEFSFKDESNNTLGVMRSTSFFLSENGGGGTLSHVDLMV